MEQFKQKNFKIMYPGERWEKPRFRITWFFGDAILEPLNKYADQLMNEHLEKILNS